MSSREDRMAKNEAASRELNEKIEEAYQGEPGVEVSRVVLILIPLVVIGWSIYHYVIIRPAPWGVKPRDASHDHDE
jgi:hypothetical protein